MRYKIEGDTLPVVICQLEAGEKMITERGSMAWMSPNMKMETGSNGGIGKMFGRMFSGEAFPPISIKSLVPDYLEARDLSFRNYPEEESHLQNLMAM